MWAILMFGIWYMKGFHLRHPVPDTGSDVAIVGTASLASDDEKAEKDNVSPGETTPSESVYRLDADSVERQARGQGVVTERKSLDVGFAAGVGDGVPVSYHASLADESSKQVKR